MRLEVRHIERTHLNKKALTKVIKKYIKTDKKVLVVFDNRIMCSANYWYNPEKKRHEIKLSIKINKYHEDGVEINKEAQKHNFISSLLHELKHLNQKEEWGRQFYSNDLGSRETIENAYFSEYYSKLELEAREFENKNLLTAIEIYDSVKIDETKEKQ